MVMATPWPDAIAISVLFVCIAVVACVYFWTQR